MVGPPQDPRVLAAAEALTHESITINGTTFYGVAKRALAAADAVERPTTQPSDVCYVLEGSTLAATAEEVRPTINCLGAPEVVEAVKRAVERGSVAQDLAAALRVALVWTRGRSDRAHLNGVAALARFDGQVGSPKVSDE